MACFLLVTFLPLRPDLSWPFFIAFISVLTLFPAAGEYFLPEAFFVDDFFAPVLFLPVLFLVEALFLNELLFFAMLDFFFVAFLIAIDILPKIRYSPDSSQLYCNCSSRWECDPDADANHATQPVSSRAVAPEDRPTASMQCMRAHP